MEFVAMFATLFISCFMGIMYLVTIYKVFEISDNLRKLMNHQGMTHVDGTSKGIVLALVFVISAILAVFGAATIPLYFPIH